MFKKCLTLFSLLSFTTFLFAQEASITISDKKENNRLYIYASNTSEQDLDVTITVEGMGFKKNGRVPRPVRVPAASKVLMQNLIIERGKRPFYTYKLVVSDSLSRRVMRPASEQIKIDPKKPVLLYLTRNCSTCDTLIKSLDASYYKYRIMDLAEEPDIEEILISAFKYTKTPYDSIRNPIISIGGKLYSEVGTYDAFLEELNGKEEDPD